LIPIEDRIFNFYDRSAVIEEAKERSSKFQFPVAYIYCDQAEKVTLTASSILGSFVKQLLLHLDILRISWPTPAREKLERGFQPGRKSLSQQELTDILLELLPSFDKAVFFVDGLDECAREDSDQVLHSLKRLLCDTKLRIFVASGEEMEVNRYLPGCLRVSVSETNIEPDIREYVEKAVAINQRLTNTPSVIEDIKKSLIDGSRGM
jgi:hypothetical protein